MKHIPVDKHGNAALVAAVRALRDGEVVGLHPESRISRSLRPEAGKTGAARIPLQADAPLIPCAVWGSQRLWTHEHRELPRSIVITVDLGPAVAIAPGADPAEVTGRLMGEIRQLVDRVSQHP